MRNKKDHIEAVESYINGNVSTFKEYAKSLNNVELLELLGVFEDYDYCRLKLLWLIAG